jgi:hypothetical protein
MTKTVLAEVYGLLHDVGVVLSKSEFSRDWLGRSECYLRIVCFKRTQPSISSIAVCTSRLEHYGRRMQQTAEHRALGERFVALAAKCVTHRLIEDAQLSGWRRRCRDKNRAADFGGETLEFLTW